MRKSGRKSWMKDNDYTIEKIPDFSLFYRYFSKFGPYFPTFLWNSRLIPGLELILPKFQISRLFQTCWEPCRNHFGILIKDGHIFGVIVEDIFILRLLSICKYLISYKQQSYPGFILLDQLLNIVKVFFLHWQYF